MLRAPEKMISMQQKLAKLEKVKGSNTSEKVIVAVKSSKKVPKNALVWAMTHVVQPGDCITLLVVVSAQNSGRKWSFPRFSGDCANTRHLKSNIETSSEQKYDITDSFSQMILQLHDVYDPDKINVRIKIVSGNPCGAVAAEAKRAQASWVVLDKNLKLEEKCCMEELQCNIVELKRSQPKVLRLNLAGPPKKETVNGKSCAVSSGSDKASNGKSKGAEAIGELLGTPTSSPELKTPFSGTEAGTSSISGSDPGTSPLFVAENGDLKKEGSQKISEDQEIRASSSDTESEELFSSSSLQFQPWTQEIINPHCQSLKQIEESSHVLADRIQISATKALLEKFSKHDRENNFSGNVRDAVSLSRNAPSGPPPLCFICKHKAPVFGKPPRWFTYAELEMATGGFSKANFLAEGGFGSVHRGVLPDGLAVAVKQHKLASSQGDNEFCSEVEVLSCAQHRNVVLLIGFCIEKKRRLLVYEYICNGSLDSHLYGRCKELLKWSARQKIAVGAARGLRYLHEECRVGCIVHRDMRPNNILLTHEFEPLVGDFGLARWQPDGDTGEDTRVIGTFGYLSPEYAQSGQITEKADVYSFGVVLVELITGRKAVDLNRPKGQQCLTEWARPLLEEYAIDELIDPRLGENYSEQEVYCMLHAASLCLRRDPDIRPRMSQVLRILEEDVVMDSSSTTPIYEVGNCGGRNLSDQPLLRKS